MTDTLAGIPIYDAFGHTVDLAFLRQRFGDGLQATVNPDKWRLTRVDLPEGAMTTWLQFVDERGSVLPGVDVLWSWPAGNVSAPADGGGRSYWVIGNDIWIDGGQTSDQPNHYVGPYRAEGGGFSVVGIGWAGGTNHMKPAFTFQRVVPGSPPPPPGGSVDARAIRSALLDIRAMVNNLGAAVDNVVAKLG